MNAAAEIPTDLLMRHRVQSFGEEIANSVSHGVGLVAALVGVPFLILAAVDGGGAAAIVGVSIFGLTLVTVFLTSTLYHAVSNSGAKPVLRIIDHVAIYLLIAGTYTPLTLGVMRGGWGWTLFGIVWALGLAGIILKFVAGVRYPRVSVGLYIAMGWLVVIAIKPLWDSLPAAGLLWLLAGGVAYTGGVVFYVADRTRYAHLAWHLCVIAGATCHFIVVLRYAT
jgi:hemolysin III